MKPSLVSPKSYVPLVILNTKSSLSALLGQVKELSIRIQKLPTSSPEDAAETQLKIVAIIRQCQPERWEASNPKEQLIRSQLCNAIPLFYDNLENNHIRELLEERDRLPPETPSQSMLARFVQWAEVTRALQYGRKLLEQQGNSGQDSYLTRLENLSYFFLQQGINLDPLGQSITLLNELLKEFYTVMKAYKNNIKPATRRKRIDVVQKLDRDLTARVMWLQIKAVYMPKEDRAHLQKLNEQFVELVNANDRTKTVNKIDIEPPQKILDITDWFFVMQQDARDLLAKSSQALMKDDSDDLDKFEKTLLSKLEEIECVEERSELHLRTISVIRGCLGDLVASRIGIDSQAKQTDYGTAIEHYDAAITALRRIYDDPDATLGLEDLLNIARFNLCVIRVLLSDAVGLEPKKSELLVPYLLDVVGAFSVARECHELHDGSQSDENVQRQLSALRKELYIQIQGVMACCRHELSIEARGQLLDKFNRGYIDQELKDTLAQSMKAKKRKKRRKKATSKHTDEHNSGKECAPEAEKKSSADEDFQSVDTSALGESIRNTWAAKATTDIAVSSDRDDSRDEDEVRITNS